MTRPLHFSKLSSKKKYICIPIRETDRQTLALQDANHRQPAGETLYSKELKNDYRQQELACTR